jgi:tetratricopeptide (TPR) repeat protein/transcriptional regulator with XRE-family HTH domain
MESESKRRRGIQASPAKLRKALTSAGLRTQAALAERLADEERLEAPPRALVNRLFRGDAVDPQSLERVARALGVPAWTLYRSADEAAEPVDTLLAASPTDPAPGDAVAIDGTEPHADGLPGPAAPYPRSRWAWGIVATALVAVAAGFVWLKPEERDAPVEPAALVRRLSTVVLPISGPRGADLRGALQRTLDVHWRVLPVEQAAPGTLDPQRLIMDKDLDRVVEARVIDSGRWFGLVAYVHRKGSMQEVWAGATRSDASPDRLQLWLLAVTQSIASGRPGSLGRDGLERYLAARRHLDGANIEINVRRALTDFASAIRRDPKFADAHAGLCEALVMDNVRTGDTARLTEAEAACQDALAIEPGHFEARRARAYLARRRGDLTAAGDEFAALLREDPVNVDVLLGLGEVHLTRYARGEDAQGLELARQTVERAEKLAPQFWKPPFTLARVLFMGGRLGEAIDAQERAVALDPNVLALSNLGSFRFCQGDFAAARAAYERARIESPDAFVGDGQLGVVEYFLGDFAAAAQRLEKAVELHERSGKAGDHRLWGNYADALRRAGRKQEALSAYVAAVRLADRDVARGDRNPVHESHLAYYYEMLARLDGDAWTAKRAPLADVRRLAAANDPITLTYVAVVLRERGEEAGAQQLVDRVSQSCPGYARSPDLVRAR